MLSKTAREVKSRRTGSGLQWWPSRDWRCYSRTYECSWKDWSGDYTATARSATVLRCLQWLYSQTDELHTTSGAIPLQQVYQTRHDKPPFATRCCYLANGLTNFTSDRQTNKQTNRWTASSHENPRICERGLNHTSVVSKDLRYKDSKADSN